MREIQQSELVKGKKYKVVTDQNEVHEFTYLGNQDVLTSCGKESFLIKSDKVFTIN